MQFFERPEIENNFKFSLERSNIFSVLGPKGVGKSTLIRSFLFKSHLQQPIKFKWVTISNLVPLNEKLGFPNENSLEEALNLFSQNNNNYNYIVWDDVHLLPEPQLSILVSFLKNTFSTIKYILLSDENKNSIKLEVPFLVLEPLNEKECKDYINNFLSYSKNYEVSELLRVTGGLPFLINLWVQTNGAQNQLMGDAIISLFSEEEKVILAKFYFLNSINESSNLNFEKLLQKFYLQKDGNTFIIQPYLKEVLEQYLSDDIKRKEAFNVITELKLNSKVDYFLIYYIALRMGLEDELLKVVNFIEPQRLEHLSLLDLNEMHLKLFHYIEKIKVNSFSNDISDSELRVIRLFLKSGILLGQRSETIEQINFLIEHFNLKPRISNEYLWLLYELIYWSNRSQTPYKERIKNLFEKYINHSSGDLKYLYQIENAYPYITIDPQRALTTLNRILSSIKDQKTISLQVAYSHSLFQSASCYSHLFDYRKSIDAYQEAEEKYNLLHLPYFAMISRLNRAFEYVAINDIKFATDLLPKLIEQSRKFGYKYILAGAHMAESICLLESLDRNFALEKINKALEMMPHSAPPFSFLDIYKCKVRILLDLGLFKEAESIFSEKIKPFYNYIEYRLEFEKSLNLEEISEQWEQVSGFEKNKNYLRYILLLGQRLNDQQRELLEKTSRGKWLLLENEWIRCSDSNLEIKNLIQIISKMELLVDEAKKKIKNYSDVLFEEVMLLIFKIQLLQDKERLPLVNLYKKLIFSISNECVYKKVYLEVLKFLESSDISVKNFSKILEFSKLNPYQQVRISKWIIKSKNSKEGKYQILSNSVEFGIETKEVDDLSDLNNLIAKNKVLVVDYLGDVYLSNQQINEFHRKEVLRKFLTTLLENAPEVLSKQQLAQLIWGETYSPITHDPRIYTNFQRLRQVVGADCIESWEGGYRWNLKFSYSLIKQTNKDTNSTHKIQNLMIQVFHRKLELNEEWLTRADLVEATKSSESTVKRELSKLILNGIIVREGNGPNIKYRLKLK